MEMAAVTKEAVPFDIELLQHVRHALRNPINAMIGYSEIWLEDLHPQQEEKFYHTFHDILSTAKAMLSHINEMLSPEKISSMEKQELEASVREIIQALDPSIHQVLASCEEALAHPSCTEDLASDLKRILTSGQCLHELCNNPFHEGHFPSEQMQGYSTGVLDSSGEQDPAAPLPDDGSILVVDDNAINGELLSRQCRRLGYSVKTALDGIQASKLLQKETFDLVLLDIVMPKLSGMELLKMIRKKYSFTDLPVIMVTARAESADIVQALEIGANDYITKPFALPVVTARVKSQLLIRKMVAALERANEKLKDLSFLDGLTGIPNRRRFDDHLQGEWRRMMRRNLPLSLIMVDIDHFKSFNDTYGHEEGDRVLKLVASTLNRLARRSGDLVARYGGEEFAVILPENDNRQAMGVAEKMRQAVSILQLDSDNRIQVTISAGVCTMNPHPNNSIKDLLSVADALLYQAKNNGRNRVEGKKVG